jgi:SRSO17 transposase
MTLEMLDELAGWGHVPPVMVGDAGYGEVTGFRAGLDQRSIPYVLAVKATTSAHPGDAVPVTAAYSGRGRPPRPGYPEAPTNLRGLALAAGRKSLQHLTWRKGTKTSADNPTAAMRSRFAALRVRPANRDIPRASDGSLPECWLIVEWPAGAKEPTDYWLSTLPADTPVKTLVALAKIRWRIEHDYRELKTGLGLDHFEGRSWTGWHRHATLVAAAQLFLTTLRLTSPKAPGAA